MQPCIVLVIVQVRDPSGHGLQGGRKGVGEVQPSLIEQLAYQIAQHAGHAVLHV